MKKTTLLLILMLIGFSGFSQLERTRFFTLIDSNYWIQNSILELKDQYLYSTYNGMGGRTTLHRVDKKGRLLSVDTLTALPNASFSSQTIQTTAGYVIAFSITRDVPNQNYEYTDVIVRNYNENHELLFETELVSPHEDILIKLIQTNDNGFLVLSNKYITSVSPATTKMYLTKLDKNGLVVWEKIVEEESRARNLSELDADIFLLNSYNAVSKTYYNTILDKDGNILQNNSFSHYLSPNFSSVIPLSTSELMLFGSCKQNPGTNLQQGIMLKMKIDGTVLDSAFFNFDEATQFFEAVKNENTNFTLVGGKGTGATLSNPDYHRSPFICEINEKGDVLWKKEYPIANTIQNIFGFLTQTKDKGYLVGSFVKYENQTSHNIGLYKLDCYGNDSLTYYYKDSICNPADCQRYANDYQFSVSIDSNLLELNKIRIKILNTTELNSLTWNFGDGYTSPASILTTNFDYLYEQAGLYELKLIFSKGSCSDTNKITLFVGSGLGLENINAKPFSIMPNPNNGTFNVLHSFESQTNLKIYNSLVRLVYSQEDLKQKEEYQVHLKSGLYMLSVENKNGTYRQKMVVK